MINKFILLLVSTLLITTSAWAYNLVDGDFNVTVTARVSSVYPDTLSVSWHSITADADSLMVRWDLNATPDDDSVGVYLASYSYVSDTTITLTENMPEGAYIWFVLLGLDSTSAWSEVGRDSLYIDETRGWPRVVGYFTTPSYTSAYQGSVSVFDLVIDGADELLRVDSPTGIPRVEFGDTLHQYNPEIIYIAHSYLDNINFQNSRPAVGRDSVEVWMMNWATARMDTYGIDSLIFWVTDDTATVLENPGDRNGLDTLEVSSVGELLGVDWSAETDVNRPVLMLYDSDDSTYDFGTIEGVYGVGADSFIIVDRNKFQNCPGGDCSGFDINESIYIIDSSWHHDASFTYGARMKLRGMGWADYLPFKKHGEMSATILAAFTSARDSLAYDGTQWDNFYRSNASHRSGNKSAFQALDDSALIFGALNYRTQSSDLNLMVNSNPHTFSGIEDSTVNMFLMGEDNRTTAGDRYSGARDLLYEQTFLMWNTSRYRYGMRSGDNWPPYRGVVNYDGNVIDEWRYDAALATIFGIYTGNKVPFSDAGGVGGRWLDEFGIDTLGVVAFSDTIGDYRWWLGQPTKPVQSIVYTVHDSFNLVVGGTFEDSLGGWAASNTAGDTTAVTRDAGAAITGSWGMKLESQMAWRAPGANPVDNLYVNAGSGSHIYYDVTADLDLAPMTEYTLEFKARTGVKGLAGSSRLMGVRLRSSGTIYQAWVHVPQTTKQFYLPVYTDTSRTSQDTTDVQIQFGLTPIQFPDTLAQVVYIDDVRLVPGITLGGYSRTFEGGWIVANVRNTAITVNVPGDSANYSRITGTSAYTWSDSAFNTGLAVDDSLTVGVDVAYFLFGSPQADVTAPSPVTGVAATDTFITKVELTFDRSTDGDGVGYVAIYWEGDSIPVVRSDGTLGDSTSTLFDSVMVISGLADSTQYSFTVLCYDTAATPNYSDTTSDSYVTVLTNVRSDLLDTIAITIDADSVVGGLSAIWQAGIGTNGLGFGHSVQNLGLVSEATGNKWNADIGWSAGTNHIDIKQWNSKLATYGIYLNTVIDSVDGIKAVVKFTGTPAALVDSTLVGGKLRWNVPGRRYNWAYQAYPPAVSKYADWQQMIYDELKYIVVASDSVQNENLFGDTDYHSTLGLGDDIWFGLWYGVWGPDPFQFAGTISEFDSVWKYAYAAAESIDADFSTDIQLGLSFGQAIDSVWRDDGFIDSVFIFSAADSMDIDWVEYQFRHFGVNAVSAPLAGQSDRRTDTKAHLIASGYDTSGTIPIRAVAWRSQDRVLGGNNSIGQSIDSRGEIQSEIEAALVPTRIADMAAAGQDRQWHEFIQDAAYTSESHPLFGGNPSSGHIGIATLGEDSDHLGLQKAAWNALDMINRLGNQEIYSSSDSALFWDSEATVNVLVTKDTTGALDNRQVLIWSYISPMRYVQAGQNNITYGRLYSDIIEEIGDTTITVAVTLSDLPVAFDEMNIVRWTIDKYTSNGWEYRDSLCNAMGLANCRESGTVGSYTIAEMNNWRSDPRGYNNDYNVSVDLSVTERLYWVEVTSSTYTMTFDIMPYSVTLITLTEAPSLESEPISGIHMGEPPAMGYTPGD